MRHLVFLTSFVALSLSPESLAAGETDCTVQITDAKPSWTAYKTTDKAAVSGTFNDYQFATAEPAASLSDALAGLNLSINPASVESNNAPRNATIASKYFALFENPTTISGKVLSVTGNDESGTSGIQVTMNGQSKDLDFSYTVADTGELQASVSADMLDFALNGPWASLHEACKALHTGADGVAKTWTEVMLKVSAKVVKSCK